MQPAEIELLNLFASSELVGALLLGKHARMTNDPFLVARLTHHCFDEMRHSWLWTDFMEKNSIPVRKPTHGKSDYFSFMSEQKGIIDFLASAHVYEIRIPFHFRCLTQVTSINPDFKKLIEQIAADEKFHLAWVRKYFNRLQNEGDKSVAGAIERAGEMENKTYKIYVEGLKNEDAYLQEFGRIIEKDLPRFDAEWKNFLTNEGN